MQFKWFNVHTLKGEITALHVVLITRISVFLFSTVLVYFWILFVIYVPSLFK